MMQHKKLLISAGVILLAGIVAWFILKDKQPVQEVSTTVNTENPAATDSAQETKKIAVLQEETYYRIEAYYPETHNARANNMFKEFVAEQIKQFKQDTGVENITQSQARDLGLAPDRKYTLSVNYESSTSTRAYNYIFSVGIDSGGAHPNNFNQTFVFAATNGDQIKLAELFQPGTGYISVISKYVQAELKKREFADSEWIEEGASAKEENFQNFVIKNEGIEFIFDPYQVAPYAAGVQRVTVPFPTLNAILKPEFKR